MSQLILGIIIGVVWAYVPAVGYVAVRAWLDRRGRKRAVGRLLAEKAVAALDPDDRWGAW